MTETLYERIAALHSLSSVYSSSSFANKAEAVMAAYRALTREQAMLLAAQAVEIRLTPWSSEYEKMTRQEQVRSDEYKMWLIADRIVERIPGYYPDVLRPWHRRLFEVFSGFRAGPEFLNLDSGLLSDLLDQLREPPAELEALRFMHMLYVLVWTPNEAVVSQFREFRVNPPVWANNLPGYSPQPTNDYITQDAGWVLTDEGRRRDLTLPVAYDLVPRSTADETSPVQVVRYVDETCPWCERHLVDLFDFDLTDTALAFMSLTGTRLRIRTCVVCVRFVSAVHVTVDFHGTAAWDSAHNDAGGYDAKRDSPYDDGSWIDEFPPEGRLILGNQRPTPYEALVHTFHVVSQVGGHPAWLQGPAYPKCPGCGKHMIFIAQVETEPLFGHAEEGTYYAHLCADCGQAATVFQQT